MLTVRLDRLALAPGQWVLDLGCGEGRHVHGVGARKTADIVGVDLDEASLAKGRDGSAMVGFADSRFVAGDAFRLPFRDATFDAVICSEVLEHLTDYKDALREIHRVVKPGGLFAASVPTAWPERLCWRLASGPGGYADQPGGHVRIFRESELRDAIETEGFHYLARHRAHGLHSPYWWLKCAFWGRDPWIVRLYHRLLVWDILKRPWLTRALDRMLSPAMGKSLVLYFREAR